MKISELGEFELITRINEIVANDTNISPNIKKRLIIGIGDDTAAWKCQQKIHLLTTDTLVQDVHFKLAQINWKELGYKAIAISMSDIASMGGQPEYVIVSLCLPNYLDIENITDLYAGMLDLTNHYNTQIIGGNISSSDKTIISTTIHGNAGRRILTRSSACPGEQIAITGYTGLSAAAVRILNDKINLDMDTMDIFFKAHNKPEPRIEFGQMLVKYGVKTAIDISDGLVADLKHICEKSRVGALLNIESIPIHPLLKEIFKDDYLSLVLSGGEDYELLFTAQSNVMENLKRELPDTIHIIGTINKQDTCEIKIISNDGGELYLNKTGWNHFK